MILKGDLLVRGVLLGVLAFGLAACGCDDDCAPPPQQTIAVFSAFPAELAPLVEAATIEETVTIDDHIFRRGVLAGVPVVVAMTGVGLVNAENTTRTLLDHFEVTGIVFSGVAGSTRNIGDVTVPVEWRDTEGRTFPAHPPWLALAEEVAASGVELERCAVPVSKPDRGEVCMPQQPIIAVGGFGSSSDPFNGMPFNCTMGGNDVFGCDIVTSSGAATAGFAAKAKTVLEEEPVAVDMETAAVARVAAEKGLPFIAFRAVSDGANDPLGLMGFFEQFFAYYRLAADNAAIATIAFLERLG